MDVFAAEAFFHFRPWQWLKPPMLRNRLFGDLDVVICFINSVGYLAEYQGIREVPPLTKEPGLSKSLKLKNLEIGRRKEDYRSVVVWSCGTDDPDAGRRAVW